MKAEIKKVAWYPDVGTTSSHFLYLSVIRPIWKGLDEEILCKCFDKCSYTLGCQ